METLEFNEVVGNLCKIANVKTTDKTVRELKKTYKNLYTLFNSDDLHEIKNEKLKEIISLVHKFSILYSRVKLEDTKKLSSPKEVVEYLRSRIGNNKDEEFMTIFLNAGNRVIAIESISKGVVNRAAVYVRKVAELALKHNCVSVIISHNHQANNKPSEQDIIATSAVVKGLKTLEINMLDHLIITPNDFYSFKDNGLV